jgi:hypothetical protein
MVDLGPFAIAVFGLLFIPGPTNSLLALAGAQVGFVRAWQLAPTQAIAYDDFLRDHAAAPAFLTERRSCVSEGHVP